MTALQLCLVRTLRDWGVEPVAVVGHSSGEIAAACAAGLLSEADAIKAAYYHGHAAKATAGSHVPMDMGMLAAGLGPKAVAPYLEGAHRSKKTSKVRSPMLPTAPPSFAVRARSRASLTWQASCSSLAETSILPV